MFPYWFWAPFPGGGVTLKNLAEEGELHCEARSGGDWRGHSRFRLDPQRLKCGHLL